MSGLFGFLRLDRAAVSSEELIPMAQTLAHRGGDSQSIEVQGYLGMGHVHRAVTSESRFESLPRLRAEKGYLLTADSRIDNREELFNLFNVPRVRRAETPDSELICLAFEKWGRDFPKHLDGEFSIVLWDSVEETLFCVTDHLGHRPLYYYFDGKIFAFASEIKALRACPFLRVEPDLSYLERYMRTKPGKLEKCTGQTFFTHVKRLPGNRVLCFGADTLKIWDYWDLEPSSRWAALTAPEAGEICLHLVKKSVANTIRSPLPIAVSLSGGLDSSFIACIAADLLMEQGRELLAVSSVLGMDWSGPERDERTYIELLSHHKENLKVQYVTSSHFAPQSFLQRGFEALESPLHHFNDMHFALLDRASKEGAKVFLSGELGDFTVSHDGRGIYGWLTSRSQWARILHLLKHEKWRRLPGILLREIWPSFLSTLFTSELGSRRFPSPGEKLIKKATKGTAKSLSIKNLRAAHHGMTSAVPFGSRELWEFLIGVRPEVLIHKGERRSLLKNAGRGILPRGILQRQDKDVFYPDFFQHFLGGDTSLDERLVFPENHRVWEWISRTRLSRGLENLARTGPRGDLKYATQIPIMRELSKLHFYDWLEREKIL